MYVHQLKATATEADLTGNNYIPLDGQGGSKKLPANKLFTKTAGDDLDSRITAIENFLNGKKFLLADDQ